jgi:hypothetical protein
MTDSPLGKPISESKGAAPPLDPPTRSTQSSRRFMLPLTGAWILGLDWLLFSQNVLSLGLATPIIVVIGFFLGSIGTYLLQRRLAHDDRASAGLKSLVAGIAVGVPWPIFGTAIGGWVLLASGLPSLLGDRGGSNR